MKPVANETGRAPPPIDLATPCGIAAPLAAAMREAREALAARWLDRIAQRSNLRAGHVFPSDELLDHVPLLIDAVAAYLESTEHEITAEGAIAAKAIELGTLRHEQGFRPHEIQREFEILGGILFSFLANVARSLEEACPPEQAFVCAQRVQRALAVIQRVTTTHYLRAKDARIHEREQRLRRFNAMVSHELRNRLNALLTAAELLTRPNLAELARASMASTVEHASRSIRAILGDLMELSRLDPAGQRGRNLPLSAVVEEAMRQLRDMACSRGVKFRVRGPLPRVEVNAAVVELCLINYLSNAIKYCDPGKSDRWTEFPASGGSTFCFSLPLRRAEDAVGAANAAP